MVWSVPMAASFGLITVLMGQSLVSNHKDHPAKVWLSLFLVPSVDGEYPGTFSVDGNSEGFIAARPGIDLSREIALSPGRHRIAIHLEVPTYKPPLSPALGLHFRLR